MKKALLGVWTSSYGLLGLGAMEAKVEGAEIQNLPTITSNYCTKSGPVKWAIGRLPAEKNSSYTATEILGLK